MPDIYYKKEYANLYSNEKETVELFELENEFGKIKHIFLKREIPILIDNEVYYDLISPYGYSGPVITKCVNKYELVKSFQEKFKEYCLVNNIVSEFVRFHPLLNNQNDFIEMYNPEFMRYTVGTSLQKYEDPISEEFSKSCRRDIRQTLKKGVTYKVHENVTQEVMENFVKIYEITMKRLDADKFYFFDKNYFDDLLVNLKDNIVIVEAYYNDKIIGADLYMVYNQYIHLHLSGTLDEYVKLAPTYITRFAITKWGKEKDYKLIHHGGGITNNHNDGLLKFKQRFGKTTSFEYFIGKKIWNRNIYDLLVKKTYNINNKNFPVYRR